MVKTDEVTEQSRALDPAHQVGPPPWLFLTRQSSEFCQGSGKEKAKVKYQGITGE
jgi:hypothetical protein